MSDLDGKTIAISGAGGSLGPLVAERLAAEGASLALSDIARGALDPVLETLGLPEGRVDARAVDLLDGAAAAGWAAELVKRFGRVDGLMHLVGGWRGGEPIATASLEDYEWLHDALVRTTQHASRGFYEALNASGGRFALISSSQAQDPDGANAAYAAAKAAAESWTLALADAFAKDGGGATANVIVVNAILTPAMREKSPDREHPSFTPAEAIADACAFLCSDSAARMNGKRLPLHP